MREVKTRAAVEQPKMREKSAMPRAAVRILQRRYAQEKRERKPEEYATEQVQQGAADAAQMAASVHRAPQKMPLTTSTGPQRGAKRRTQRMAQRRMLQRTKSVAHKAGQELERVAQAVGRTVRSGFGGIAAAGGGVVLVLLLALPLLAAVVSLPPAGIVADGRTVEPTGAALEAWERLPEDLSVERRMVVTYALALVDKVDYFWGGKSLVLGWDDRWGEMMEVTAEGDDTTGTERPYGLDCSGFVDWAFYNASGGSYIPGQGGGAAAQHGQCADIPWEEVQPGDLVFYPEDDHVGIAAGRDGQGRLLVVHCAAGAGGVTLSCSNGFTQAARPGWYGEE
mgnify:CR=1 FL=1